jgi:uncharacterized protein
MTPQREFADSLLHAFVDDQLEAGDRARVLAAMEADALLRERVCELRRSKEWVRLAFDEVRAPPRRSSRVGVRGRWLKSTQGLAASVLLMVGGFLLGWFAQQIPSTGASAPGLEVVGVEAGGHRVLLHIDHADPTRFLAVLEDAEYLLETYRDQGVKVDVLANAGGIDLLRADVSPHALRIAQMIGTYPDLRFLACANSIARLREQEITPILIDRVNTSGTAVDHVVDRLQRGWTYIRA